jgi:hypothetical protein
MKLSSITQRFISDFQQRTYEFACFGNFTHVLFADVRYADDFRILCATERKALTILHELSE